MNDHRDEDDREPGNPTEVKELPPPDPTPGRSSVSAKQLAANRANAKRSTGPGPEGKKVSSRNATKAGHWAKQLHPVESGPFAENPDEFYANAENLIAAIAPRDPHEWTMAKRVASALIRMDRADRYEAALMLESTDLDDMARELFKDPEPLERAREELEELLENFDAISDEPGAREPTIPWTHLALGLRKHGPDPRAQVDDVWTTDLTPLDEEVWRVAATRLFRLYWSSSDRAFVYLLRKCQAAEAQAAEARRRYDALVAKRHVNITTDVVDRPRTAAWTEYQRAMKALRDLQERALPDD